MKDLKDYFIVIDLAVSLDNIQGLVDDSASKPALRQDMVEKTCYDIAQYLGAFGAYLIP